MTEKSSDTSEPVYEMGLGAAIETVVDGIDVDQIWADMQEADEHPTTAYGQSSVDGWFCKKPGCGWEGHTNNHVRRFTKLERDLLGELVRSQTAHADVVVRMAQLLGELSVSTDRAEAVLSIHRAVPSRHEPRTFCAEDGQDWPCATAQACGVTS